MENEVWRDIPGYEGLYQASNLGRIRSLDREVNGKLIKGRIMSTQLNRKGYVVVSLSKFGVRKAYKVHRCVYSAFHGPIPEGMQVNHISEIKTENRLENLNLLTNKENCNWGNYSKKQSEKHKKAILQFGLHGDFIKEWESGIDIQATLGYDSSCVSKCCRGEIKTAYGSIWRYKEKAG